MLIRIWNYNFQPIPTLFTIPTFMLLMSLGFWQLQRLSYKEAQIKELQEQVSFPAVQLPTKIKNINDLRYRQVKVQGEYMHDKEIFLYSGNRHHHNSPGFMLFTPLKTIDGRVILIDRGWISASLKPQANRLETLEPGIIEITGHVMLGEEKKWVIPENDIKKNIWFYINLKQIQNYIGAEIENFYIMKNYENGDIPIGNNLNLNLRNYHLEYAIIWFIAAFTLIIIFILYHRDKAKTNNKI